MQSHKVSSCEMSSDCLRNQIHPGGVALAAPSRLSIGGDHPATSYLKFACHGARRTGLFNEHCSRSPVRLVDRPDRDRVMC
jgi:hypothetical protein